MFCGTIKEYAGYIDCFSIWKDRFFLREGNRLRVLTSNNDSIFFELEGLFAYKFEKEKIWVRYKHHETKKYIDDCRDVHSTSKVVERDFPGAISTFSDNKFIYNDVDITDNEDILCVMDHKTSDLISYKADFYLLTSIENDRIFAKTIFGEIYCFDLSLNVVWKNEVNKENSTNGCLGLQIYNDLLIANVGADGNTKRNGRIGAFSKLDGSIAWSSTFDYEASNCLLIGDSIYIAHNGKMVVLKASNGEVLVDELSGFEGKHINETLWSDGKRLFMISHENSSIRIFSNDGKTLVQELIIPDAYFPRAGKGLFFHNERYYLPVHTSDSCLKGVIFGLLVLEESGDDREPAIEIPEWPVMNTVLTVEGDDGKEFYHVLVTSDKLENVLRYGAIKVKAIASTRGWQTLSDDRRNPNFGGKILFSSNIEEFEAGAEDKIKSMLALAEKWAKETGLHSGNGKDPIRMELIPLPQG